MPNNYILLETIALTQSAASVTFDNLPTSGYTDLKVVLSVRSLSNSNTSAIAIDMLINGVSTNRSAKRIFGVGSSTGSDSPSGARLGSAISTNTATASTFSSLEIYFPNYRSSNNKSFSVDSVSENNSTSLWEIDLTAGLWSSSAAITSFAFSNSDSSSFAAGSTFSLYGIAAFGTTPVLAPKATGGNSIENDGTYWIHTFTSSGNFVPQTGLTADVLVVAGGGGGGYYFGSGGGGGGLLEQTGRAIAASINYPVTIGGGGAKSPVVAGLTKGANGTNSIFDTITALGGGGGNGGDNGSGGAGGNTQSTAGGSSGGKQGGTADAATQGNSGGATGYGFAGSVNSSGGGGGGAGAVGSGQNGGAGRANSITGTSITYAGGGGGQGGTNGTGGGATINRGGGGKGDTENGGSGIIVIRYPIN